MSKRSSDKGKEYERHVAKVLSEWCGCTLIRTPMSGAWQGTAGDIIPKNRSDNFPFTVECKKQEGWVMEQIMAGCGLFQEWVVQSLDGVSKDREHGREVLTYMLIFSRNFKPDYIAMQVKDLPEVPICNFMRVAHEQQSLVVMELSAFMNLYTFNQLIARVEPST